MSTRGVTGGHHAPALAGAPWACAAGWCVIAAGSLALAIVAGLYHPVGDYVGETDFYGGYVEGARLFQAGHLDPGRYRVVGPLYDILLGLLAWPARDFFVAAKLIAIASAVFTWILWRGLVAARLGDVVAFWSTAFLVANPVFFQCGYSVVSHGTLACLEVASLAALLRSSRSRGLLLSGGLAGAAALVRYPGVVLLPSAWLIFWLFERRAWASRGRATAIHLAGFLLVTAPWVAFSLSRGQVPGGDLFGRASFYLAPVAQSVDRDAPGAFYEPPATQDESLGDMVRKSPGAILQRVVVGACTDLADDARKLLGIHVAALVLLGLAFAIRDGTWRPLLALGAPWLLNAILLAPVFYNAFYALVLLPFYLTLAGVAIGSGRWALTLRGFPLKPLLAAFLLALSIRDTAAASRRVHRRLPTEVREAGRVLARLSQPGQHVTARKGHIGYYGGLAMVAFPRVTTLGELADYCRKHDVGWIYYSWFEALLRPEFRYLLDPEAAVPGLGIAYSTQQQPCRLFRIGAGFGAEPAWWGDENQRRVHMARGAVQVLDDRLAWAHHLVLAQDAAARHDAPSVLEHADAAIRGRPDEARAWAMRGVALHAMGRRAEARAAYETALRLKPGLPIAEQGLRQLR